MLPRGEFGSREKAAFLELFHGLTSGRLKSLRIALLARFQKSITTPTRILRAEHKRAFVWSGITPPRRLIERGCPGVACAKVRQDEQEPARRFSLSSVSSTRENKAESKDFMNTPTVLITGALTGIGRAAALAFAREGARIVVSGRHDDKGKALVSELRELGAEATFIKSDVRYEDEVRALVDETVRLFGRLDVAVNNAGTEGKPGPLTDQTAESYAATFDTNVLGTLLSIKHELRVMLPQGSGSIVNVSSTYGRAGGRGRHHEVCGHRTRRHRRSCQHCWTWSGGNGNVQPLCAKEGKQS